MKILISSTMLMLSVTFVSCQSKKGMPPFYKNAYGELCYVLPDSIKFTSVTGVERTILEDKSMKMKNLILYKDQMLYSDYGVLYSFDFGNNKKDTLVTSDAFISGCELIPFEKNIVVFNNENLSIVDINGKQVIKEITGDFSNAELVNNELFYAVTENNTETGVYVMDLNSNSIKKLLNIPKLAFFYPSSIEEKWTGMKLINKNLFVHIDDKIYIIDCDGKNPSISFETKFPGGVVFEGLKGNIVSFNDNGHKITVNLKTRIIKQ